MLSFSTLLLRSYYAATGWNEDNLYSNITRSSSALLDFPIPDSLVLQLAKAPTDVFFTSYALDALPQLNGSVSYITTSVPVRELAPDTSVRFRDVVERFRVFPPPRRPAPKDEIWHGGRRVEGRDYLLYSRLHLPTLHLTGLATARIAPTLQAHLAFINQPAPSRPLSAPHSPSHRRAPSADGAGTPAQGSAGNLHLSLTQDTGRWSGEYTYSAADGMVGLRGLYNFGWQGASTGTGAGTGGGAGAGTGVAAGEEVQSRARAIREGKRIDEEDMMDGGLRGRFSAGGEVYFSAKQRSFGISTGLRFTTTPLVLPLSPGAPAPSPPTTLTLLYNPLIGFLSTSYSAQVSRSLALSSRFGVNVYSYESDLAIGGEWWIGQWRRDEAQARSASESDAVTSGRGSGSRGSGADSANGDEGGARRNPVWARRERQDGPDADRRFDGVSLRADDRDEVPVARATEERMRDERDGVLKARLSGNWSIALLYESRIRNCLVSIGVIADLLSRQKPVRALGLEVQYYS
ncbi:Mitochondrial distribution and morphology protein 10 [Cryptotrichosporon argae]